MIFLPIFRGSKHVHDRSGGDLARWGRPRAAARARTRIYAPRARPTAAPCGVSLYVPSYFGASKLASNHDYYSCAACMACMRAWYTVKCMHGMLRQQRGSSWTIGGACDIAKLDSGIYNIRQQQQQQQVQLLAR